ncbi:DUF3226 domain-containing protein [Helicobacter cetorum]|uniref:Uncharacterized protein n=1 Tax=Helicobacter cetorum (strain ATCC BAA-540 / CCUG 52418 / MIT 99-5656) TaxID=1163745 RepID=I0ES58_HELCM|nr:DUF3226 domain-containing protein [Helicobacter cetorum]AFI05777.1 hypothetical protein HCD_03805 [Helicobacter cetorum MIT 99-5656]
MKRKIIYVEGESDKIFLMLLNKIKGLGIEHPYIIDCESNTKLSKKAEGIKEYLKAHDVYIIFDSDNNMDKTHEDIKKQLQEKPNREHRLSDEEFEKIKIFLLPKNDGKKHSPKYCELEHLLEKIAKQSENKACYEKFREHYDNLFNEIKEIKSIKKEQKTRSKYWLYPYIMLFVCLRRSFVPCGMTDLDSIATAAKILDDPKNVEILKKLFNFEAKELDPLIEFLKHDKSDKNH